MTGIAFAIALTACAFLAWDGWRRFLVAEDAQIREDLKRLSVDVAVAQAKAREVEELEKQVKDLRNMMALRGGR